MELKTEIKRFLDTLDRSPRTVFTYQNALKQFVYAVGEENVELTAEIYTKFLATLKSKSPPEAGSIQKPPAFPLAVGICTCFRAKASHQRRAVSVKAPGSREYSAPANRARAK